MVAELFRPVLWRVGELTDLIGAEPVGPCTDAIITHVDVDPERCGPGSLFVAARYPERPEVQAAAVKRATDNGAVAAIVGRETEESKRVPTFRVESMRQALRKLARTARARSSAQVVSITGSVGKTTTKDMIAHALSFQGVCYATKGNYNGNVGFPAALASLPGRADFAILEMSAARKGAIQKRARDAGASIGIVTNIGPSHLGFFSDEQDILREKLSSLDFLRGGRVAILGRGVIEKDRAGENLIPKKKFGRIISVGTEDDDDVRIVSVKSGPASLVAEVRVEGHLYKCRLPMAGKHFADSVAFCAATALALGADVELALSALATFTSYSGRSSRWRVNLFGEGGEVEVIDDSQNSSPASVRALLSYLRERDGARKVLLLGDILELGEDGVEVHESLEKDLLDSGMDVIVTVGPLTRSLVKNISGNVAVHSYDDVRALVPDLRELIKPGDLVALKASGGMRLSRALAQISGDGRFSSRASQYWVIGGESAVAI